MSLQSYAEHDHFARLREARKAQAAKAKELHLMGDSKTSSSWGTVGLTIKNTMTGTRSTQYGSFSRTAKIQRRRSNRGLTSLARPEPAYQGGSKGTFQPTSNSEMTSISESPPVRRKEIKSSSKLSNPSLENLAYFANEGDLMNYSRNEIIKALFSLRNENKKLKQVKVPSRVSSLGGNVNKELPPLKSDRVEQQEGSLLLVHEELSRVQKELSRVQKELVSAQTELSAFQKECEQERLKAIEADKQRKRAFKELAQMSKVHANPYDDQHFKEQVELLQHKVDHWVRNQDWSVVDDGANNTRATLRAFSFLRSTSHHYLDYVSSPRGVERLVEAYIWQFLTREIFGQKIWAVSLKAYQRQDEKRRIRSGNDLLDLQFDFQQSVAPEHQELVHEWRVAGARLLAAREPHAVDQDARHNTIQELVLDLTDELDEIAFSTLDRESLLDLFDSMVNLDFEFSQQKPHYFFYPDFERYTKMYDTPFSPTSMNISIDESTNVVPSAQQSVKLVLRPGLLKHGNLAGKKYSQGTSILNMTVEVTPLGQQRYGPNRV